MATTPKDTTKAQAARIAARITQAARDNESFYAGDHWLENGRGWGGQSLTEQNAMNGTIMSQIQKLFTPTNVIGEIVDRFANTLIGEAPLWSMDPRDPDALDPDEPETEERSALAILRDETNEALTSFWDHPAKNVMEELTRATAHATMNGRAYLRLFIPKALIREGVIATDLDFARAVESIWIEFVHPEFIEHSLNPDTMDRESRRVFTYKDSEGKEQIGIEHQRIARLIMAQDESGSDVYIEDYKGEAMTLIDVLNQAGDTIVSVQQSQIPLDGHLLTFELRLRAQIDEPIRRQQIAMNTVLTMMRHNILGAGFFERILLNAQLPGRWAKSSDPNHPEAVNGYIRVEEEYTTGLGQINSLVGHPIRDKESGLVTGYTTPQIWTHEPSPVDTFTASRDAYRQEMLASSGQLHAVLSGDAVASGVSRQQALADFLARIRPAATQVQGMTRWLLESVAYLAGYLSGDEKARHTLKATVKLKLTLPPLDADAMRVINEMIKDGTISAETGLGQLPFIDDPEAEIARRDSERAAAAEANTMTLAASVLNATRNSNTAPPITQPAAAASQPGQALENPQANPQGNAPEIGV
jgi:hypothetical protein